MDNSTPCTTCGYRKSTVVDGLMYCSRCNTQITNFNEYAVDDDQLLNVHGRIRIKKQKTISDKFGQKSDDVQLGLASSKVTRKRRRKSGLNATMGVIDSVNDGLHSDAFTSLKTDITSVSSEVPYFLYQAGIRIATFTKMIAKASVMMKVEMDFPSQYPDQCFAVFQRYLAHCEVAFTDDEYTEDLDKMFKTIVINANLAFEKDVAAKKKQDEMKTLGMSMLATSLNPLADIAGGMLNEDLTMVGNRADSSMQPTDEGDDAVAQDAVNMPTRLQTIHSKLNNLAVRNAASIYLELDALVSILHIAAMTLGCQWVLLSDIVRWIREDRSGLSRLQATSTSAGRSRGSHDNRPIASHTMFSSLDLPLYEFVRIELWLWQSIDLASDSITIDFEQLVARMLYNLNLPKDFMSRVWLLLEIAPPSQAVDEDALAQQGTITEGFSCRKYCDGTDRPYTRLLRCFGRPKMGHKNEWNNDVFFSTETKILAYTLLALKLSFGLDDIREHSGAVENVDLDEDGRLFSVVEWMYQLKMRLRLWEGHDVSDVVQQHRPVLPLNAAPLFGHGDNNKLKQIYNSKSDSCYYVIHSRLRDRGFRDCVPATQMKELSYNVPNPFSDETRDQSIGRNDDDAIYAPLRAQPFVLRAHMSIRRDQKERELLAARIDQEAVNVMKRDYSYFVIPTSTAGTTPPETAFLGEVSTKERLDSGKQTKKWRQLFPESANYVRYPRPLWAHGGVLYLNEVDEHLKRQNKLAALKGAINGPRSLFASRKSCLDAINAARPYMSQSFRFLLETFAKTIGEIDFVLYSAFMMLELQVVDRHRFSELAEKMVDGATVPLDYINIKPDGSSSHHTVRVSSFNDIEKPQQLDRLRFGLPRDWAVSAWDLEDEADSWGESSSEEENETEGSEFDSMDESEVDSDVVEVDETGREGERPPPASQQNKNRVDTSQHQAAEAAADTTEQSSDNRDESTQSSTKKKKQPRGKWCYGHYDSRVFDWDTLWSLITMRYW